jgi:hypothetical protein
MTTRQAAQVVQQGKLVFSKFANRGEPAVEGLTEVGACFEYVCAVEELDNPNLFITRVQRPLIETGAIFWKTNNRQSSINHSLCLCRLVFAGFQLLLPAVLLAV